MGLIVASGVRAGDYATGADDSGGLVSVIEAAAPLSVWAAVIGAGALLLAVGMLLRRHGMVWAGYGILWIVYLLLTVGVMLGALDAPNLDGVRGAGPLLVMTLLHFLLWLRTGARPLSPRDSICVEEVVYRDGGAGG